MSFVHQLERIASSSFAQKMEISKDRHSAEDHRRTNAKLRVTFIRFVTEKHLFDDIFPRGHQRSDRPFQRSFEKRFDQTENLSDQRWKHRAAQLSTTICFVALVTEKPGEKTFCFSPRKRFRKDMRSISSLLKRMSSFIHQEKYRIFSRERVDMHADQT